VRMPGQGASAVRGQQGVAARPLCGSSASRWSCACTGMATGSLSGGHG
jgi:hypothetical protein